MHKWSNLIMPVMRKWANPHHVFNSIPSTMKSDGTKTDSF